MHTKKVQVNKWIKDIPEVSSRPESDIPQLPSSLVIKSIFTQT